MARRTMKCAKKGSSKKGCASKTHKGRKDYTTKKTSKYFDRKGHRYEHAEGKKTKRRPYSKKGSKSRKSRKNLLGGFAPLECRGFVEGCPDQPMSWYIRR